MNKFFCLLFLVSSVNQINADDDLVPEKELWAIHTDLDVQEQDFFVRKTHANSIYR
jgi:hypothetical protein